MAIITYTRSGRINIKWQRGKSNEFNINTKVLCNDELLSKEGKVSTRHPESPTINVLLTTIRHDMETAEQHLVAANRALLKDDVRAEYERVKAAREAQEEREREFNKRVRELMPKSVELADSFLEGVDRDIERIQQEIARRQDELLDLIYFRNEHCRKHNLPLYGAPPAEKLITAFIDKYITVKVKSNSNKVIFTALKQHLEAYNPALSIEAINKNEMYAFERFLWEKRGALNSTIKLFMQKMKTVLKWFADEATINPSFAKYKFELKEATTEVVYFTKEEVHQIEAIEVRTKGQQRCKDLLLLMVSTGLRMSDTQFSFSDITTNERGIEQLKVVSKKTNQLCIIDLNPMSQRLIRSFEASGGVPTFTSKYFNTCIRGILKDLPSLKREVTTYIQYSGPNEVKHRSLDKTAKKSDKPKRLDLIGSHTGRRTFINLSLQGGMGREKLREQTGHTTNKNLGGYVNAADDARGSYFETFA